MRLILSSNVKQLFGSHSVYTRYGRCLDKLNMHIEYTMHAYIYIQMMIVRYCRTFVTYCNCIILLRYQFIYQGLFQILKSFCWLSKKNQTTFPLVEVVSSSFFPPSKEPLLLNFEFPPFWIRTNATEVPRIVYTGTSRLGSAADFYESLEVWGWILRCFFPDFFLGKHQKTIKRNWWLKWRVQRSNMKFTLNFFKWRGGTYWIC